MYARAREHQADAWVDELREIADDSSKDYIEVETPDGCIERRFDGEHVQRSKLRIDTIKWLVGKHAPRRFGEKIELAVSGTVEVQALSDDELEARLKESLLSLGITQEPKKLLRLASREPEGDEDDD